MTGLFNNVSRELEAALINLLHTAVFLDFIFALQSESYFLGPSQKVLQIAATFDPFSDKEMRF